MNLHKYYIWYNFSAVKQGTKNLKSHKLAIRRQTFLRNTLKREHFTQLRVHNYNREGEKKTKGFVADENFLIFADNSEALLWGWDHRPQWNHVQLF